MSADPVPLDSLLLRWRSFPPGDRRAILRRLAPEQQADLSLALTRAGTEDRAAQGRYSAYSPWLTELLAACMAEPSLVEAAPALKPAVLDALKAAHTRAEQARRDTRPTSLLDLLRTALREKGLLP